MRGISILVGVNAPATNHAPLTESETHAWKMAELAHQAGYRDIHVLLGNEATREAVRGKIAAATRSLRWGDTLLVAYSGHGSITPDLDGDEADGYDETWCLTDGDLLDDELAACWRLAPAGARIVLVSESCFGGGMARGGGPPAPDGGDAPGDDPVVWRGVQPIARSASCITRAPAHDDGIAASVLVLASAAEGRHALRGIYIPSLLEVWRGGTFRGSYCDLHRQVRDLVRAQAPRYNPQILMVGAPDLQFPLETAFHLDEEDRPVMRDGSYRT